MSAIFFDLYFEGNPLTSKIFGDGDEAIAALQSEAKKAPHFVELRSNKNTKLLIGLGSGKGCAQFSSLSGDPPYLMACLPEQRNMSGSEWFYISGELSEVPCRYCVPLSTVLEVVRYFVDTGGQSGAVEWDEI